MSLIFRPLPDTLDFSCDGYRHIHRLLQPGYTGLYKLLFVGYDKHTVGNRTYPDDVPAIG